MRRERKIARWEKSIGRREEMGKEEKEDEERDTGKEEYKRKRILGGEEKDEEENRTENGIEEGRTEERR